MAEVIDWYRYQRAGLENEFSLSLEAAIKQIERDPLIFQLRIKGSRVALLQRFPYKLVFKVYDSRIKILGVFHHSRNPNFIRKRLK